jgi:hypothetical protein
MTRALETVEVPRTNHRLHRRLTLLTAGGWGIVWIILAIVYRGQTRTITRKERRQARAFVGVGL